MKNMHKKAGVALLSVALAVSQMGLLSVGAVEKEVEYKGFSSSSTLYADGYDYSAWNVSDRDFTTAWVEGVSGDGVGESITISVPDGIVLTRGVIFPGYLKSEDLFFKNGAPNRISIKSGYKSVELNAGAVDSFSSACSGYQFKLGDGLVVQDGMVTISIDGVRTGTKYTDTCITELVFYTDDELTADASGNVIRVGAANAEVVEEVSDVNVDGWPTEDEIYGMMRLSQILYEDYLDYGALEKAEISLEDLTEENKAMGLFWYQYNTGDERVRNEGEFNAASLDDLKRIQQELYGSVSGEDMLVFLSEYCVSRDGNTIYMSGTGDFGAVGEFYFDEPFDVIGEDGVLTITGSVMVYSGSEYVPDCCYEAVFVENKNIPGKFSFDSVKVY